MRSPKRRHTIVAALVVALSAVPAVTSATPARAATRCVMVFAGPSPSVEVDTNNDGNPEYRVPSLSDVTVCSHSSVSLLGTPARVEPCNAFGPITPCWRVLVHPQAGAEIEGGILLCRAIDQVSTCSTIDVGPWRYMTPPAETLCIGIDLHGGKPCSGGTAVVGFE